MVMSNAVKQGIGLGVAYPLDTLEVQKLNDLLLSLQLTVSQGNWWQRLFAAKALGTAVTNTTTETTIIPAGHGSLTLPTAYFSAGTTCRWSAVGFWSTDNPAVTATLKVKKGSTVILTTGAQTPANGISSRLWQLTALLNGYSGTTVCGEGTFEWLSAATGAWTVWSLPLTSAVTINSAQEAFGCTVTWGAGVTAASSLTCTACCLETAHA